MTVTAAKITRLNAVRPIRGTHSTRTVSDYIRTFIDNKAKKSENTAIAYMADIKYFFMFMCNKDLTDLEPTDLVFEHTDILEYQNHLVEKYTKGGTCKGSTVNRKIASVKSLMQFLARDNNDIRIEIYDIDKMDENMDSFGNLSVAEWLEMCERVKSHEKGEEKSVLIELAGRTSIRLQALLRINMNEVRRVIGVYVVDVIDKGNKEDTKAIPDELFERMKALGVQRGNGDVFGLARNTVNDMMTRLREEMNIPSGRKVVFHSFKKVAINDILQTTGNLIAAQQQGNHGSANTTIKHYAEVQKEVNLQSSHSLLLGKEIDLSMLDGMSAEQMMSLIRSLSRSAQAEISNVAKNFSR